MSNLSITRHGEAPWRVRFAIAFGGLYVEVRRLENEGYITKKVTPPSVLRGGRPGYLYELPLSPGMDLERLLLTIMGSKVNDIMQGSLARSMFERSAKLGEEMTLKHLKGLTHRERVILRTKRFTSPEERKHFDAMCVKAGIDPETLKEETEIKS